VAICSTGEIDQLAALFERERAAGRVVEVGDDVGERHGALAADGRDGGGVDSIGLERGGSEVGTALPE
jgi:hypothetical protein